MKNAFDLIIFDWDGTLVDSIDWNTRCLQQAAVLCGYDLPDYEATKNIIGLSIDKAMRTLFPTASDEKVSEYAHHYSQLFFSKAMSRADFFAGVYEMLIALKQHGYLLAVATGKTRKGLNIALQATQTADLFCQTRCADETASKPNPQMCFEILQATGISAERALMVGDSIYDLQMANNANISAVAITGGAHSTDVLQMHQPLLCLNQPADLLNYLL